MTVRKRGNEWWYDFGNHKYRGPIPEARTKYEAEQAEIKIKRDVFEGKYGKQFGTMLLATFVGDPNAAVDQFGEGTFWIGPGTTNDHGNMISFACARCCALLPARRWAKSRQVQSKILRA